MRQNLPVTQRERSFSESERLISTTDHQGKITYVNDAFVAISGFSREELIGQPHNIVRHPDMPPAVYAHMWETIKCGKPWMGIVKNRCKNGDHYWVSAYVTAIHEHGRIVGFESVRSKPTAGQKQRAGALYARLQGGKAAVSRQTLLTRGLLQTWPTLLAALVLMAGVFLLERGPLALLLLLSLASLGGYQLYRNRSQTRETLAKHPKAFTGSLVAMTFSDGHGDQALLDMAMISEEARIQTALTRLEDAAENVRQRAVQSTRLSRSSADSLDQQRSETDQSATAINEMAATIQEVAQNVQDTSHAADEADRLALRGRDLAGQSLQDMELMGGSVQEIGKAVRELADSTQSIGSVVDVITSIAEQTNLLALNAAIEAARAGEQGRGFAVVADEVRALAGRTRESTEQIHQIIASLHAGADKAVSTASRGEEIAQQSMRSVESVREALDGITQAVSRISGMSQQMAAASEQQAHVAEDINQQITRIAQLSEHSAQQAQQGVGISQELEQMAEYLHRLAERFNR